MVEVQGFLDTVGENVSQITQTIISSVANLISNMGADVTLTQAKVINMLIILVLLYIFVKIVHMTRRPLQIGIIVLLVFLGASIIISFIV